jgi:hypothetical protein
LDEPEDENFFEALGHRFKNTIDTLDTPKWLQDFGQGSKKPKWMSAGDGQAERSGSSRTEGDIDVRRWFGGGNSEGRIRL